jgi:predicted nucleotidyltransferase
MDGTRYEEVAGRHGIVLLLQFGSTVTGTTHPESDLDLAVLLGRASISLEEQMALQAELEALHPGSPLDLVFLDVADPLLLKKVTEACRLLFGSPRKLHELKILAFKRYQDHRRFLDLERSYVQRMAAASRDS